MHIHDVYQQDFDGHDLLSQFLNKDEVVRELHGSVLTELALGAQPCKLQAANSLAAFFQILYGGRQSGELYKRLILEFARSTESCWYRLGFLMFCKAAAEILDHK